MIHSRRVQPITGEVETGESHAPKSATFSRSADGTLVELDVEMPEGNRQPAADADPATGFWKEKAASVGKRMRLNGETTAQMVWAQQEQASGRDHSADQPWKHEEALAWVDRYLKRVLYIALAPKVIVMVLPLFLSAVLVTIPMAIYGFFLPAVADRPVRHCGFIFVFYICMPFISLPLALLAGISLLYDYAFYYLLGIPLWLMRGAPSRAGSLQVIAPFRNGPSVWQLSVDFFVCVMGQCTRNGMGAQSGCAHRLLSWYEVAYQIAFMILATPSLKYWMNANPWAFDLKQRYVQQITTTGIDMPPQVFSLTARRIISRCKQKRQLTKLIDNWQFLPHYPYPPSNRRYALGMQQGGKNLTLLVHVTHAMAEVEGVKEQLLVSNSSPMPVYRVMLWYNNPYHPYTGWVEASSSNGGASQPDKPLSGEHPMWLVTSSSPLQSQREGGIGLVGPGFIDRFFDWWLPVFMHGMRTINFGKSYADAHRESVISKDGVSRPAAKSRVLPAPEY